jgi:hypothetical protein
LFTLVLWPLPALGLAARLPATAVAGLALLGGVGMTVFNLLFETALHHNVSARALSRVSAYEWFGSVACQPIGQATAGPLAAQLGTYPALWLTGTTQLLVILAALAVPAIRRLPAGNQPHRCRGRAP